MKYINLKKISLIMMTGFVLSNLTGCQEQEPESTMRPVEESDIKEMPREEQLKQEDTTKTVEDSTMKMTEEDITNYITEGKNTIEILLNNENVGEAKEKVIDQFIILTDFIFYDTEIGGIKFSELNEGTKQNILETYYDIDTCIENKFPGYKDSLGEKYNFVKDKVVDLYNQGKNKVKDNLSDETLDNLDEASSEIKDAAQDTKDFFSDVYDKGKSKVKIWYEQFREEH